MAVGAAFIGTSGRLAAKWRVTAAAAAQKVSESNAAGTPHDTGPIHTEVTT